MSDDYLICESCEKTLNDGDMACSDGDGCLFCEACAPTWADTLAEWEEIASDNDRLDELDMSEEDVAERIQRVKAKMAQFGADAKNVCPL